ncbi:hypothetical protein [Bifidobacterium sp. UTBIF-78]|uniref:hypothetical protein n=1 Tax=Bifidobacterium sp. UTBIF-78 TaxID=1465263 RepID=UPI001128CC82|nr:hypothetical protein [Bifidobacterium sp. UTBIF-78]
MSNEMSIAGLRKRSRAAEYVEVRGLGQRQAEVRAWRFGAMSYDRLVRIGGMTVVSERHASHRRESSGPVMDPAALAEFERLKAAADNSIAELDRRLEALKQGDNKKQQH